MNVKLVTLTAAALALLVGCTPGPDAPPPGVTPVPAASLPLVPAAPTTTTATPAREATTTAPVQPVPVTRTEFACRALTQDEAIQVRDYAITVGAAAVDIDSDLSLVAVERDLDHRVVMFLFNARDKSRVRFAHVSDQWDGTGFGIRLINHAQAVAQVKACATSADAPTRR